MTDARRPLSTRNKRWPHAVARTAIRAGLTPNQVSVLSVVFAGAAGAALVASATAGEASQAALLVVGATGIQLRLLCNLIDGLMAVEGGLASKTGDIFNDLPDRLADILIIAGAGYAAGALPHAIELGWAAAALAVLVAYVRVLGAAVGAGHDFRGPMAKPHRMALLTGACAVSLLEGVFGWTTGVVLFAALIAMAAGCVVTLWRRTAFILDAKTNQT